MDRLRWGLAILSTLAVACDGQQIASGDGGGADAGDGDACACSAGLAEACAADAATCPPDLGTPAFDTWAKQKISAGSRPPTCLQSADCTELFMVVFGQGVDCNDQYFFDAVTNKLVGLAQTCDGFALGGCTAASECLPNRCMPRQYTSYSTPASCPPLPDAGVPDASTD